MNLGDWELDLKRQKLSQTSALMKRQMINLGCRILTEDLSSLERVVMTFSRFIKKCLSVCAGDASCSGRRRRLSFVCKGVCQKAPQSGIGFEKITLRIRSIQHPAAPLMLEVRCRRFISREHIRDRLYWINRIPDPLKNGIEDPKPSSIKEKRTRIFHPVQNISREGDGLGY